MAEALTAFSNGLAQSARPTWYRRAMKTRRSSCTGQLALLGSFFLLSLGCGAPPEDLFDSDSSPLYSGPGPAQILVSTSPRVSERCPGELAATYCSATEVSAAADSCRRRLPPDVVAACPRTGCVQPYAAYRDRCVAGATYPTATACRTPVADDCAFYRACLESAHPCGASGYALGFGERMCYAFVARRAEFSAAGQAWLRGVRTCLQRALVPLLPASTLACSALGDAAYASHAGCYTAADNSICDLPFTDVLTLAAVLSRDLLDPRAIRQMGEVAKTCLTVAPAGADPDSARERAAAFRAIAAAATDAESLQRFLRDQSRLPSR